MQNQVNKHTAHAQIRSDSSASFTAAVNKKCAADIELRGVVHFVHASRLAIVRCILKSCNRDRRRSPCRPKILFRFCVHRLLAARDAGLQEIPVVIMTKEQLRLVGFTDSEIDNDPWIFRNKLSLLRDSCPYLT